MKGIEEDWKGLKEIESELKMISRDWKIYVFLTG